MYGYEMEDHPTQFCEDTDSSCHRTIGLKVCVTCNRYAPLSQGQSSHGQILALALERELTAETIKGALTFHRVACLSGCRHPGNLVIRIDRDVKYRFASLTEDHVADIVNLVKDYCAFPDQAPEWSQLLRNRLVMTMRYK